MAGEQEMIWMHLHRLSVALDDAGLTRDERMSVATTAFHRMPPMVRRELLRALRSVVCDLSDLESLVIAVANHSEQGSSLPRRDAS